MNLLSRVKRLQQTIKPRPGLNEKKINIALKEYHNKGVAVVPNVFSNEEVNDLRKASLSSLVDAAHIKERGYKHNAVEYVGNKVKSPSLIFWPSLINETMEAFRIHPCLQSIASKFLGPDIKQLNNQFYYRLPGDGDQFSWHQDIMFRHPREAYPNIVEDDGYLQTAIVVDKMDSNNAPIIFIEGSHKFGDFNLHESGDFRKLRYFDKNSLPDILQKLPKTEMRANPGDLIVWSSLTVHGSCSNKSLKSRFYYMNGFARSRNCKPWPSYLEQGQIVPLNPDLLP